MNNINIIDVQTDKKNSPRHMACCFYPLSFCNHSKFFFDFWSTHFISYISKSLVITFIFMHFTRLLDSQEGFSTNTKNNLDKSSSIHIHIGERTG